MALTGKRDLPRTHVCIKKAISFAPRHLKLLDEWAKEVEINRSEMIRRMIDERASRLVRTLPSA